MPKHCSVLSSPVEKSEQPIGSLSKSVSGAIEAHQQVGSLETNHSKMANPNWVPGVSGNPSGRPKVVAEIRELARQHTEVALQALVEVVKNKKAHPSARVAAANSLLDRAYGRPETKIEAEITRGEPTIFWHMPLEELARMFELASEAGIEVREPQPELLEHGGNGTDDQGTGEFPSPGNGARDPNDG
jgi:hypothetical protein